MEPLRIGTLGAARITPAALVKPAATLPDVEVVAVAARDRARAEKFAAKHGIPTVHAVRSHAAAPGAKSRRTDRVEGDATYWYQLRAFARAVRERGPVLTPPADSVANMRVIDAVYRAAGLEPRQPTA